MRGPRLTALSNTITSSPMSHSHDHSHDHSHTHGPDAISYAVGPFGWSIAQRLGVVAGALACLWLLVLWALAA